MTMLESMRKKLRALVKLIDAGGSKAMIDQAKEESQSLGIFIRSLVGLEREAATHAFSEFITGTTAAPDQIEFIEHIIQELTQNGVMAVDRLYESPFIDMSPMGPEGLFSPAKLDQLVDVLAEIRARELPDGYSIF